LFRVVFSIPSSFVRRCVFAAALVAAQAPFARAQQLPTPDQARRLLETRPDLVAQLRREIQTSGLTPDQIRARLRAAGYPDDLLDAYMPSAPRGHAGARDSLTTPVPTDDVLDAIAALGLADSVDTSDLRSALRARAPRALARRDSMAVADSARADDSLDVAAARPRVDSLGRLVNGPATAPSRDRLRRPAALDTGATIFGLSVFGGSTTQFDANLTGPVDATYRIGAGDRLVLIITGDAERAFTLDVTREGFVVVPGVGEVPVANLTMRELEDQLYAKLARVYSGLGRGASATTHFSINLARLHTNQIYVLGDVDAPGSYRVSSAGTALTALYAAGGPTRNGGMRRVEVRRGGKLIDTLDLYDYLLRADGSHDPRLQSGDVVFVPVHGPRVRVYGEVVRPGTYELRRGESLTEVLRAAGGFTPEASRQRVQVSRILPPDQRDTTQHARVVIDVTSSQPDPEATPAFPLEAGDVVRVFRVSERVGRRVTVQGDVGTPGAVGFTSGMRLSDAVRLAGGLKADAYLGQVLVSRLRGADSSRVELRSAFRDVSGRAVNDIALQEDDEIRVFSITEFRAPEYVAITGAVRRPGRYAYREGLTLRDLVLLAGGLEERASVREAEIARRPDTFDGGRLAVSQRVSIDSSYVVASQSNEMARPGVTQAGSAREVVLQAYDNVLILARADWARPRRVVVTGEVASPGTYTLLTKGDRLSDVLKRAGGLTTTAYAGGIVFYRHEAHLGRIGVDLPSVLKDANARDNLILADGDSIYLPQFSGIVEVQGAVNAPRGVAWVPGAKLDYYVRAAGGLARNGEMERAYVTQPDGSVESIHVRPLWPDAVPEPRPGSVVYVTEHDPQDKGTDATTRLAVIAQIVGSLVAIAAILHRP
jgi:protein involved in polysaccharide export with SLBB domain